jgi:membrane protein
VLFLLVAVFFLFHEVEHRINSVWEAKKTRHFGLDLLIYLLVLALGPLFLAGSLFVSSNIF